LDWIAGSTVGGLALLNSEGRAAWRKGFSEQMSGMTATEREGLAQLTPTSQTGRKGFGDYGSHALGAVNYGLDFVGNQIRANIAARQETGQWIATPWNRKQLSAATHKHHLQALKGKEYSFLNPDSQLSLYDKQEKNPTWWKTTARTVGNVVLDTVTGGPDPIDLVIEGRRGLTRTSTKGATRALPPSPKGGAIVPTNVVTVYPTPVKSKPLNPARTLPAPPQNQKLLPSRYIIDDPWEATPSPFAPPSSPTGKPRTTLALPGTVEPLGPDLQAGAVGPSIADPWRTPITNPLGRPVLPKEGEQAFQRVSPYHPLRADQFTPEADPWGGALSNTPPPTVVEAAPGIAQSPRLLPPSTRGGSTAIDYTVPDPWETPTGLLPPMTWAAKFADDKPLFDLNRAVPLTESIPVFLLPPASGIGKLDTTPQLARPWTPDTVDVLPAPVARKPETWELYETSDVDGEVVDVVAEVVEDVDPWELDAPPPSSPDAPAPDAPAPDSVEARIAALEKQALENEARIAKLTQLKDELEADPFVAAVRAGGSPTDPDLPQKVLSHAIDSGTLQPIKGGGLVSSPDVVRAAQYKLVDLRLKQSALREQAANTTGAALRKDQLLEEADQIQQVINDLRTAITGRPLRKDFTAALSPEEVDDLLPVIPMDVLDPTPRTGPDFINKLRTAPVEQLPDIVLGSTAAPVSRTAEELSALALVLGHINEPRDLGWEELAKLNREHGLYSPRGAAIPRETVERAIATGVSRVEVAKATAGTPRVTMVARNTPRVLTKQYTKAVTALGKDYRSAMPDDQAWAALTKLAPMSDESYLELMDTWVTSDGRGGLRRALNPVLSAYPPTETMYAALTARYGALKPKERAKLPKGLRELLADPTKVRGVNDVEVHIRLDKTGDNLTQLENVTDTPIPVELAVTPDTQSYAARYSDSLRRAQDTREALVELEAQALTIEAQAGVARTDLQRAPAIEPRSLLEGTHENGTYQDTIVRLYEDTLDEPEGLFPQVLDDWSPSPNPAPPVVYEGRWYASEELPSTVDPSRGNIPPGWRLVSVEPDMAQLNASARVPANTIFAEVDAAPVVRKYSINSELRVVSVDTVLPDRVRANLAAAIGTHLPNPTGARLGEALGQLDTKLTVHDVLRLFENDHIRVSPNTPISEVDGARYNVAVFAALGGEVDLIDLGGGAYLVPHQQLGSALKPVRVGAIAPVPIPPQPTKTGVTPLTTRLKELSDLYDDLNTKHREAGIDLPPPPELLARADGVLPTEWSIGPRVRGVAEALEQGIYTPQGGQEFAYLYDVVQSRGVPEIKALLAEALAQYTPSPQQIANWAPTWKQATDPESWFANLPGTQRIIAMGVSVNPSLGRGKLDINPLPPVSPEKAAELRFALDSTFLTPEPLRGPSDSLREFVHRTANLDQVLQEHLQKATQLADEGAESLDELLDELDTITRETEEYVAQAAAELQLRKAEQQAQRLEIEHLDIDELADPRCL
jgi:hypothetical protein